MKHAAAVVVRLPDGRVLVGTRTQRARSWPGTMAFPGGGSEPSDEALPVLSRAVDSPAVDRATVLRELGEETGYWRLCRSDGSVDSAANQRAMHALRTTPLAEVLAASDLVLDDRDLLPLVSWRTWGHSFAVRQFLLPLALEPAFDVDTAELAQLCFVQPRKLLEGWASGRVFLIAPILRVLRELAAASGLDDAVQRLRVEPTDRERARMELVQGAVMLQARTPTLPPATHTNSPLLGFERALLVDPATPYPQEHERFDRWLFDVLGASDRVEAIFLTHHHVDHVGDVERLRKRLGVPVWAHALTAARMDIRIDRLINDGERIELPGLTLQALHTPGHAHGHLCLWDAQRHMLVAGDMVAGIGSILIDPDDGHMGTYLASLERLIALQPRAIIPSHGYLLADGAERLRMQVAHREKRQAMVVAALTSTPQTVRALVPLVYADTPAALWPLAERALVAALTLCLERGQARGVDTRFVSTVGTGSA